MLTYHLRDTGRALATLDFDGDFVGGSERIGWHVLSAFTSTRPRNREPAGTGVR